VKDLGGGAAWSGEAGKAAGHKDCAVAEKRRRLAAAGRGHGPEGWREHPGLRVIELRSAQCLLHGVVAAVNEDFAVSQKCGRLVHSR
jgi:hypothetical protein